MTFEHACMLARALSLLNAKPRFGPGNRRQRYDSYSVAGDLEKALKAAGWNPYDPALLAQE